LAEWLLETGIGETRAALVEHGRIIEAIIERDYSALRAGAVVEGKLSSILVPKKRGIVTLAGGAEALIEPLPPGVTEGGALRVEVVREALPEAGRPKLPRVAVTDAPVRPAPTVEQRLRATGQAIRRTGTPGPDLLEDAGWSELLDEATRGEIAFTGGGLRISLTPAMTLIDVDGDLPPAELARAGAAAAGAAIRRLDITGSIGIDLPTMNGKGERVAAAAALDAALPPPFERTAVNGFGFMQIIRRRQRPSLPEMMQADPPLAAALALLRRAERAGGAGALSLVAHPAVIDRISACPQWMAELERRIGAALRLQAGPGRAISAGDVIREHP
jgi:hypothetical protein